MQQIMRRTRRYLPADKRFRIGIGQEIRCCGWIGMGKYMVGEPESECCLTNAFRAFDQDRMVALAGAIGLRKKRLRFAMAEKLRVLLRRNCAVENALNSLMRRARRSLQPLEQRLDK